MLKVWIWMVMLLCNERTWVSLMDCQVVCFIMMRVETYFSSHGRYCHANLRCCIHLIGRHSLRIIEHHLGARLLYSLISKLSGIEGVTILCLSKHASLTLRRILLVIVQACITISVGWRSLKLGVDIGILRYMWVSCWL